MTRATVRLQAALLVGLLVGRGDAFAGADEWTAIGPEGGFVRSLLVDPQDSSVVYAGTNGGIFRSNDGGDRWHRLGLGPTSPRVVRMAAHPLAPQTLYAASEGGGGFFKSEDGGLTWRSILEGLISRFVTAIAFQPDEQATLYVGTADFGASKSVDGGESWERFTGLPDRLSVSGLLVDPLDPDIIYVAADAGGGIGGDLPPGGIFKSDDGGVSWRPIVEGFPADPPEIDSLTLAPSAPRNLYATPWRRRPEGGTSTDGLFRSRDGGESWTRVAGIGGFPCGMVADARNPMLMYGSDGSVYKSDDGGDTWRRPSDVGACALALDASTGTVYAAGLGTVYRSEDEGESWTHSQQGLTASGIGSIVTDPERAGVIYATTLYNVLKGAASEMKWESIADAAYAIVVDPLNPSTVYAAFRSRGVERSDDGGLTWTAAREGIPGDESVLSLAIDSQRGALLYAGTSSSRVYRTSNGGRSWQPVSPDLAIGSINRLILDPFDPMVIYAGGFAFVSRSTDGGANWTRFDGPTGSVFSLAVVPTEPRVVYACLGGELYESRGEATRFVRVSSFESTGRGASVVVADPFRRGTIYVGAFGGGVFRSDDGGETWVEHGLGLPLIRVTGLAFDGADRDRIYAATEGGGVFTLARETCDGDCDGDGIVSVDEILVMVDVALGGGHIESCFAGDADGSGSMTVDEIVKAVTSALYGCPEVFRYRLVEGSSISVTAAAGSQPSPPEPLSGTFTVIRARPYVPNTELAFILTDVEFEAASGVLIEKGSQRRNCSGFDIDAGVGCIEVSTSERDTVFMNGVVVIDGREVGLNGMGPVVSTDEPPSFEDLEICGAGTDRFVSCFSIQSGVEAGYVLRIFAVPES